MSISVKKNIIFNYIGQIYTMGISILILPLFLKLLGPENYGIVAFFMMVQGWMTILDMGMSPTLNREIAANKDYFKDDNKIYQLLALIKSLKVIFIVISLCIVIVAFLFSDKISSQWLTYQTLNNNVVNHAIFIIGIVVSVRWFSGLYRSAINGYEEQVWLNKLNVILTTLKNPISLMLLYFISDALIIFFYYQLLLSLVELFILSRKLKEKLPKYKGKLPLFSIKEILRIKSFAGTTAISAILWVFLTQFDKLLMSKFLSLEEFGYFSLIVSVSSGIMMLSGPVSIAILPRLTALYNSADKKPMVYLFLKSTSLVSVTVLPIALIIIVIPEKILYLWTGNIELSSWGAHFLSIYSLGSLCVVYSAFLHYIQFAHGNLKYHLYYGLVSSAISIPLIYILALYFSVDGVAMIWFLRGAIGLVLWAPFIFYKFLPGYYKEWIIKNILYYAVVDLIVIYIAKVIFLKNIDSRLYLFIIIFLIVGWLFLTNYIIFKKVLNKKYEVCTNCDSNI